MDCNIAFGNILERMENMVNWLLITLLFFDIANKTMSTLFLSSLEEHEMFGKHLTNFSFEIVQGSPKRPYLVSVLFRDSAFRLPFLPKLINQIQIHNAASILLFNIGNVPVASERKYEGMAMDHVIIWLSVGENFHDFMRRVAAEKSWSPTATHLVLLESENWKGDIAEIFHETWRHWVSNVAVAVPKKEKDQSYQLLVYTHFPYAGGVDCGKDPGMVEQVATWKDGRFLQGNRSDIFPQKFLNLHECVVRISTIDFPPISIIKGKENDDNIVDGIDGLHGYVLDEVSKRMNFTTEIFLYHASRYQNTSNPYKRIMDRLSEDLTDMILGEFVLTPDRYEVFGEGFMHYWACMTFLVPVDPPERFRIWMTAHLAQPEAWIALLSCILFSCAAMWFVAHLQPDSVKCLSEKRSAIIDALAAFAGVSLRRPPKALATRMIFPAICMAGLVSTTAIRAQLVSMLSSPAEPSWFPSDITELAESNIRVGGPISYTYLAKNILTKAMKTLLSRYEQLDEEDEEMGFGDIAIAGMEQNLKYRSNNRTEMRLLKACPLPLPTSIFLHKGSLFQPRLNELSKGLTSGGFITKWRKDLTRKMTFSSEIRSATEPDETNKITIEDLMGTFALYGVGLILSLTIFAIEKLIANKPE